MQRQVKVLLFVCAACALLAIWIDWRFAPTGLVFAMIAATKAAVSAEVLRESRRRTDRLAMVFDDRCRCRHGVPGGRGCALCEVPS